MSDSDGDFVDGSGDEEAPSQNQSTNAGAAPGIPLQQVVKLIRKAAEDVNNGKKPAKLDWKGILPTLDAEAANGGFSKDLCKNMWTLLAPSQSVTTSHHASKIISQANRMKGVSLLVPNEPIDAQMCRRMINDIVSNVLRVTLADELYKNANHDFKFANAVMEQLFGLTEYNLLEPGWMDSKCFNDLFILLNIPEMCEWTCVLLRQTAHGGLVKKVHAEICITNMKKAGNLRFKGSLMNLHFLYQMLKMIKPDLVPWDLHSMAFGNVRPKGTSKKLQERLYTVLQKQADGAVVGPSNGFANSQKIFKEFRPANLRFTKTMVMNCKNSLSLDTAIWSLFDEENMALLNLRPELLEMLDSFFLVVFRHRFLDTTPNLSTPGTRQQYLFILESCRKVSLVLQNQVLSSLDWWLPKFLITWDRDLWREEVLNLVKFLSVGILQDNGAKQALNNLGRDVVESTETLKSYQVWLALESLLLRWVESAPVFDPDNRSSASHHEAIETLYTVMVKALIDFIKDFVSEMTRLSFVEIFLELFVKLGSMCQKKKINFLPVLPNSLFIAIFTADQFGAYESFCEYMNLMQGISLRPDAEWKGDDLDKLAKYNEGFKNFFIGESPMLALFDKMVATMTPEDKQHFLAKIGNITYQGSPALSPYLTKDMKWNIAKLKGDDAVHLAAFVHTIEAGAGSTQQGAKAKKGLSDKNLASSPLRKYQQFTSTPMPKPQTQTK